MSAAVDGIKELINVLLCFFIAKIIQMLSNIFSFFFNESIDLQGISVAPGIIGKIFKLIQYIDYVFEWF